MGIFIHPEPKNQTDPNPKTKFASNLDSISCTFYPKYLVISELYEFLFENPEI